jgi:hypothetical protein
LAGEEKGKVAIIVGLVEGDGTKSNLAAATMMF